MTTSLQALNSIHSRRIHVHSSNTFVNDEQASQLMQTSQYSLPSACQTVDKYIDTIKKKPACYQQIKTSHIPRQPSSSGYTSPFIASACLVDEEAILQISRWITEQMLIYVPELFSETSITRNSRAFTSMIYKVKNFIFSIRNVVGLLYSETIHLAALVQDLLRTEQISRKDGWTGVVSNESLGTLLLCAMIVTFKVDRDHVVKNSWWAKAMGIPTEVVTQSERIFLNRIDYRVHLTSQHFLEVWDDILKYNQLVQQDEPSAA
ncbi:uncharacterized protein MONOS_10368 [Monocercomonoides exilis]|uniref:uncharacterized protein n=1 Tax=Monocercomonoides exilis TaxID=2049356 RepID=UPI003559FE8F|nr:hypothetical protein MONOS_10368 [Monocercomonoides exilis]|eukprot:MONOS_10368.1-p1 / transcript=MONOS_10368.1 / gene=MONOS_10368 / organism=Monocercomonoides_exilis_PA203 / gene_product=unspecified product / transcript_product=unspecified product / location=Mono_scaffold00468:24703-25585(-) / protein_length=262 / sequence_SO=supercontig / SO=protein_coding / is_pseudo=false